MIASSHDESTAPGKLTREGVYASILEVLNRGRRRNPDVFLVQVGGRKLVVKDFEPRGPWVKATLGRWITAREVRAYEALAGHPSVPRLEGRIDELAFAVEYRPGRRMSRKLAGRVPSDFLERLEVALEDMHDRGVAHLDLRHRTNVMVGEDGDPILIDFGSAVCFRPGSWAARIVLPVLAHFDRVALQKWRTRLTSPAV